MPLFTLLWVLASPAADPLATPITDSAPVVITNPSWLSPPNAIEEDYPSFAWTIGVQGSATVQCKATAQGVVKECKAVAERPAGLGFGEAAVEVVKRGRLSPRRIDDRATESAVEVRVPFKGDPLLREPPKPWQGVEPTDEHIALAQTFISAIGAPPVDVDELSGGLAPDRRQRVRSWLLELYPDQEHMELIFAHGLARLVNQAALARWINGEISEKELNLLDEVKTVLADLFDSNAADIELQRRYCADYEC